MPRTADPGVRDALIAAAARILAEEGPARLTLRRVAAEVGTSTMSVYTHFGGMAELRFAVRQQGFDRLTAHMATAMATSGSDPVARVIALGGAYLRNALDNPHLYRAMFVDHPPDDDPDVGYETFLTLVDAVRACIDAGRFDPADPIDLATQLWTSIHGAVTLHQAGLLALEQAMRSCTDAAANLFVGFGDDPRRVRRIVAAAVHAL